MHWICIFLCYLCLVFLISFAVNKKRAFALLFSASFILFVITLTIWGFLRNF